VHQDQGKTVGYWEATYRIGSSRRVKLAPPTAGDRLSILSAMALATVSIAERVLYAPTLTLFDGKPKTAKPYLNRLQSDLRNRIGPASLQVVLLGGPGPRGGLEPLFSRLYREQMRQPNPAAECS
jgi:hypothetical protein